MNIFTNFAEYNQNLHYNQCHKCRVVTGCVTVLLIKAGSDEKTSTPFCAACAPALHTYSVKENSVNMYYLEDEDTDLTDEELARLAAEDLEYEQEAMLANLIATGGE